MYFVLSKLPTPAWKELCTWQTRTQTNKQKYQVYFSFIKSYLPTYQNQKEGYWAKTMRVHVYQSGTEKSLSWGWDTLRIQGRFKSLNFQVKFALFSVFFFLSWICHHLYIQKRDWSSFFFHFGRLKKGTSIQKKESRQVCKMFKDLLITNDLVHSHPFLVFQHDTSTQYVLTDLHQDYLLLDQPCLCFYVHY